MHMQPKILAAERLRKITYTLENSSQPLLCFDPDGSIISCNKAFLQLISHGQEAIEHPNNIKPFLQKFLRQIIQETKQHGTDRLERECFLHGRRLVLDIAILQGFDESGGLSHYYASLSDITRQKEIETCLRRSEERYRLMAENAYDIIGIIDPATLTFQYVSPSFLRICGYTAEEMIGSYSFDLVHPDDAGWLKALLRTRLPEGSGSAQFRARSKDGSYQWLDSTGRLLTEGEFAGKVLLIMRDITEKKQAEIALKHSEERYRLIVDNAYDGIAIIDATTMRCVYVNPALEQMLGYTRDKWFNRNFMKCIHPHDQKSAQQNVRHGLEIGEGSMQCRMKTALGSYIWLEINGRVMNRKGDNPQLLFIARDISERKLAEEQLRASQALLYSRKEELKNKVRYLNYLINTMNEVFVTYDLNRRITFVNQAVQTHLGYRPEEVLGHDVLEFIVLSDKKRMANYINNRTNFGESAIFETMAIRKNGSKALVRIKSSPIRENDSVVGAMLLLEDISESRKIQKEMARLDQLNTVGEIAAGIGHEIRNPMTTVKGFLQILKQDKELTRYQHYFDLMLDELERANGIISEFLALAKNKRVDLRPRNLNSIITALYPLLQADATLADKSIVLNLSEIPDLLLDEKEIRQLIVNLVRNGLEAMQAGGQVIITTTLEQGQVLLSIKDEGSGIDPELLEKLGTPFLTTKVNGTGLGLAICFSIVAHHEASIEPYTDSTGSTFVVRFKVPPQTLNQMTLPLI